MLPQCNSVVIVIVSVTCIVPLQVIYSEALFVLAYMMLNANKNGYSFIHSGYFFSASSSPLLLGAAPNYSVDTVLELTC